MLPITEIKEGDLFANPLFADMTPHGNIYAGLESFLAEIRSWSEADADAFFRELEVNEQPDVLDRLCNQ